MPGIKIDRIIRARRQRLRLSVMTDGTVVVRAPLSISRSRIQQAVDRHADWVQQVRQRMRAKYAQSPPRKYTAGEQFLYLGRRYKLIISHSTRVPLVFDGRRFTLDADCIHHARAIFGRWYLSRALKIFTARADLYAGRIGVEYNGIRITNTRSRWGACNANGGISLHYALVMAPLPVIDYLVIHELLHIKERNHSARFWELVRSADPEYKSHISWLRKYQNWLKL